MATLADLTGFLPPGTVDAWPKVASVLPDGSALMGGTGLAVLLRHRRSEDLDFFVPQYLDHTAITAALARVGDFTSTAVSPRAIRGTFDTTNVDIVAHPEHFWLGPPTTVDGLRVGSLADITASKYNAIATRKQLRDFIDVMCIERDGGIAIDQGVILYFRKHAIDFDLDNVRSFLRHLTDFRYLDDDPAMHGTFGAGVRETIVKYFRDRVPRIIASFSQVLEGEHPPSSATPGLQPD